MKRKAVLTHYALLGCPPGATAAALHSRYLELAWQLHPDPGRGVPGDAEKFAALTEAWTVLKNTPLRKAYDAQLRMRGALCKACDGNGAVTTLRSFGGSGTVTRVCTGCEGKGLKNGNV